MKHKCLQTLPFNASMLYKSYVKVCKGGNAKMIRKVQLQYAGNGRGLVVS